MGIAPTSPAVTACYSLLTERIESLPLSALSRLAVATSESRPGDNAVVPRVLAALMSSCEQLRDFDEDVKLVATGMLKLSARLSNEYVLQFVRQCRRLAMARLKNVDGGIEAVTIDDLLVALKVLKFLHGTNVSVCAR
jgi:hypothetical protein